jgi:hypothetical protein
MEQENLKSVIPVIRWYQSLGPTPYSEMLCEALLFVHFWTDKLSDISRMVWHSKFTQQSSAKYHVVWYVTGNTVQGLAILLPYLRRYSLGGGDHV